MTEDEARMIGKAIREEAKLIQVPMENEMERRAVCLKLAIDLKTIAFSLNEKESPAAIASAIVSAARVFEDYVNGPTREEPAA